MPAVEGTRPGLLGEAYRRRQKRSDHTRGGSHDSGLPAGERGLQLFGGIVTTSSWLPLMILTGSSCDFQGLPVAAALVSWRSTSLGATGSRCELKGCP